MNQRLFLSALILAGVACLLFSLLAIISVALNAA